MGKYAKSFVNMGVTQVLAAGDTKGSVWIEEGVQVDLRVVLEDEFGAALQYSLDQRNTISTFAIAKKMKISNMVF